MTRPTAFREHDHAACASDALARAEALCRERGARLTPQRRRILAMIWAAHKPVGAYELLDQLRDDGTRAAPPTVYRALDFLRTHGLVHRVEGLNAYIGCDCPEHPHGSQLLICTECHKVAEVSDPDIDSAVRDCASTNAFQPHHQTIEVHGLCPGCQAADPSA